MTGRDGARSRKRSVIPLAPERPGLQSGMVLHPSTATGRTVTSPRSFLAPLAALALAACAPAPVSTTPAPVPPSTAGAPAGSAGAATAATKQAHPADARFMTNMIGHHAQAIEVSRLAPARAGSEAIRVLAARIINAQQDEIAVMRQWLQDHGITPPHVDSTGAVHAPGGAPGGHDAHAHHGMPGMLTPAQLEELRQARGKEFDRLFLVNMIRHHKGAVSMVQELINAFGAAQDDTVFKLAADVNVDQTTEIDRMQKMLTEMLFGASTSP